MESRRGIWKIQIYNTLSIAQGERKDKMVDGTIRGMLKGEETVTKTLEPCDLVFVLGIRSKDESHTACQQVMLGGKGVKTIQAVDALADSAVSFFNRTVRGFPEEAGHDPGSVSGKIC